jgi:MFS family permease
VNEVLPEKPPIPGPLRRNRRFGSLFVAETISGLGDRIHIFALLLLVHARTGHAFDLGLLAIVQILPGTFLAPLAGWVIDRVDRRRLMLSLDLFQAVLVLLLPFTASLGQILSIAVLLAMARQFADPARMAVLPELVRADQVVNANGVLSSALHLLLVVGPAVAGLIAGSWGLTACFFVDAGSYVLSALTLIGLGPCPPPARELAGDGAQEAWSRFFGEIRAGLRVLLREPALRFTVVFFALGTFISSMQQPLVVVFVKDVLQGSDPQLGTLISMMGLGGILGSLAASPSKRWISAIRIMPVATLIDGGALVMFGLTTRIAPAMVLFGFFGFVAGVLQVRVTSLFQARVPLEYRGRAFAWLGPLFGPLGVASLALGTWLADAVGVVGVIVASGALEIVVAVGALLWLLGRPLLAAVSEESESA